MVLKRAIFRTRDSLSQAGSKKFDAVSVLHDHACHTGKPYVNGHCFVSLTLSVPVLNQHEGKAPLIPTESHLQCPQ